MNHLTNLAVQSGLKKDHASDQEYLVDFDWRTFGKLVVKECVDLLERGHHHQVDRFAAAQWIKEHFQL